MSQFKYEEIVRYFISAIEKGVIKNGEKLSSLRKTSRQFHCSVSVVMQAYEELECRGLIRSVEKSGFYVNLNKKENLPEPHNYLYNFEPFSGQASEIIGKLTDMARSDFLPLGAAIPDLSLLAGKKISSIITRNTKTDLSFLNSYSELNGEPVLREEISRYMLKKGVNVSPEQIVVTNGCTEGLFLALETCTEKGGTVIIESPAYLGVVSILEFLGRKVIEIPVFPDRGMDLKILKEVLQKEKIQALVVSPSFQNPLCSTMSSEDKMRLYELSLEYDFTIIEDDIYNDCSFNGDIFEPVKSYDMSGRVIYCSSFSKTLAPGLRIGWTIPGRFISDISRRKQLSGLGGSVVIESSVAEYLRSGAYDYHLKYFRKKIAANTFEIRRLIEESFPAGSKITSPRGGYFLWIEMHEKIDAVSVFNWACSEGIGIVPGSVFSASGKFRNCIRISCGSPVTDETGEGIKKLGNHVKSIEWNGFDRPMQ